MSTESKTYAESTDPYMACTTLTIVDATFVLHPYKSVYWHEEQTLIVSDLHLGKVHHFRKSGIFVPVNAALDNYERLSSILLEFKPKKLLILGDLFHSALNQDWKTFSELRQTFAQIAFDLVLGNHDIIEPKLFERNEIAVHQELRNGPFLFTHHPKNSPEYNLAGHIHPGVRLVGESKQSLRLPCFFFGKDKGLLPAFGTFTGISLIKPKSEDLVYVVSEDQIARVN